MKATIIIAFLVATISVTSATPLGRGEISKRTSYSGKATWYEVGLVS
jgi:hypothetical protein